MTIRVVIERKRDGARREVVVSHPNGIVVLAKAAEACWAKFGKPRNFGYDYIVVGHEVIA